MPVSRDDVIRIAQLARLKLTDAEVDEYSREISAVLNAMERLDDIPTEGVLPSDLPVQPALGQRPDQVRPSEDADALLAQAPDRVGRSIRVRGGIFRS